MDRTIKEYNSVSYNQVVTLVYNDESTPLIDNEIVIDNEYISYMQLETSVFNTVATGHIVVNDSDNRLLHKTYTDGYSRIKISIKGYENDQLFSNYKEVSSVPEIKAEFLISGIEVLDVKENYTTYKLNLIHVDWYKFNNYLDFAVHDTDVINAIKKIFVLNKMDIKNVVGVTSPGDKINFLSPTTYKAINSIRYLLSKASNDKYGPYIITHSLHDGKYSINDIKKLWSSLDSYRLESFNKFTMSGRDKLASGNRDEFFTVSSLEEKPILTLEERVHFRKGIKERMFDHNTRRWYNDEKDINYIKNSIPPVPSEYFDSNIKANPYTYVDKSIVNDTRDIPQGFEEAFYQADKSLIFKGDIISFVTSGYLTRNCNDLCLIDIPPTEKISNRYLGLWYMSGVVHQFHGDIYNNHITATRTFKGDYDNG